jgi:hypothetical protein
MKTLRRLAREAVIFALLGPVAVVGYYLAIEAYKAPKPAPHIAVGSSALPASMSKTVWSPLLTPSGTAPHLGPEQEDVWFDDPPFVAPPISNGVVLHTVRVQHGTSKEIVYIQRYDGTWIEFPELDRHLLTVLAKGIELPIGAEITSTDQLPSPSEIAELDRIERVLNQTPLSAYLHPIDALKIAIIFGWPLGLGIWLFYRVARFAVEG